MLASIKCSVINLCALRPQSTEECQIEKSKPRFRVAFTMGRGDVDRALCALGFVARERRSWYGTGLRC